MACKWYLGRPLPGAVLLLIAASSWAGCTVGSACPGSGNGAASATAPVNLVRADIGRGSGCKPALAPVAEPIVPFTQWGSGDVDFAAALTLGRTPDGSGVAVRPAVIEMSRYLEPR